MIPLYKNYIETCSVSDVPNMFD